MLIAGLRTWEAGEAGIIFSWGYAPVGVSDSDFLGCREGVLFEASATDVIGRDELWCGGAGLFFFCATVLGSGNPEQG